MKQIEIPYCESITKDTDLRDVSALLDTLDRNDIDTQSWPEYTYKPDVRFAMAHSGNCIFIKFSVLEKFVQAHNRTNNSPVSQDSCVEFFISLDAGIDYYNFEFNCLGACKVAFGRGRNERGDLPDAIIDRINRQALIRTGNQYSNGVIAWELTMSIPAEVFCYNTILSFKGMKSTANFYKCGDQLPQPHFIVWNDIKTPAPDFHLPEFFGKIHFL